MLVRFCHVAAWNEGEMSPGGREMATSSSEREERRPGLMTVIICARDEFKFSYHSIIVAIWTCLNTH